MDKYIDYKKFESIKTDVEPIVNDYVSKNLNGKILKDLSGFKKFAYSKITMIIAVVLGIALIIGGGVLVVNSMEDGSINTGLALVVIGLIAIAIGAICYFSGSKYVSSVTSRIETKEAMSTIFNSMESLKWITLNDKELDYMIEEPDAIKWVHSAGLFEGWSYYQTNEFVRAYSGTIDSNPFSITSLKLRLYTLEHTKDGERRKYKNEQFILFEANSDVINECEINITHNTHQIKGNLKKIKLESEEFDKTFKLLSNDEVKVRMFLTPLAQENLVKLVGEKALKTMFLYKCDGRIMIIVECKYGSFGKLNKFHFIDKLQSQVSKSLMTQTETIYLLSHLLLSFPMIQQEKYSSKSEGAGKNFSNVVAATKIPR